MEQTQIETQEILQKISPQFNLKISNQGELDIKIKGDIKGEDLQAILDSSHIRNKMFLEHQKHLERETNLMVIYIGLIFSSLIGLTCFCLFNQSPRTNTYQLGVISYVHNG
jgi:hypothetical protein